MYLQVKSPLGGIITVGNVSYSIPFAIKIKESEKDAFIAKLDKINADYVLSGHKKRNFPPKVKVKTLETKDDIKTRDDMEVKNVQSKTRKSAGKKG